MVVSHTALLITVCCMDIKRAKDTASSEMKIWFGFAAGMTAAAAIATMLSILMR